MLLRCNTPAVIVFVPFGSAHCREASQKLDFCFTQRLRESLCSTVNPSRSKTEFGKCVSSPLREETYKNIFRADVVDVQRTDFETCVSCSKIGGRRVDDVNCQTVTGSPKRLQSLFFARNCCPRNYRLADSPLAYRVRSTDFRAKERLLAV